MQKKNMTPGTFLAHTRSKYNKPERVYLLDTMVWRQGAGTTVGRNAPFVFTPAPGSKPSESRYVGAGTADYGYPVLFFTHEYDKSADARSEADAFLEAGVPALGDLLGPDGTLRPGVLPAGLRLWVVNSNHLRGEWAALQATRRAELDAEQAAREGQERENADRWRRFRAASNLFCFSGQRQPTFNVVGKTVMLSLEQFEALVQASRPH